MKLPTLFNAVYPELAADFHAAGFYLFSTLIKEGRATLAEALEHMEARLDDKFFEPNPFRPGTVGYGDFERNRKHQEHLRDILSHHKQVI